MGERFARAVKRFYPTEEARQTKITQHAEEAVSLFEVLKPGIDKLYQQDIMFAVFELQPNENPPIMHAGLESCCDKSEAVTKGHRDEMAVLITTLTKYKKVLWEA